MRKLSLLLVIFLLVNLNHAYSQLYPKNQKDLEYIPLDEIIYSNNKLFTYGGTALLRSANQGKSWNLLHDFARLRVNFAQIRHPIAPGTFIEVTIVQK